MEGGAGFGIQGCPGLLDEVSGWRVYDASKFADGLSWHLLAVALSSWSPRCKV